MATISNWVTLNEIVNTVKLRMGNLPENSHYRIMSVITSVLQEFNLHYRKTKKSAILNPNGNQFVELPEDFVDYLKIGYITPNGEILTLTKNDRLIDMLSMVCGNEDLITNENTATITDPASTLADEELDVSDYNNYNIFFPTSLTDKTIYNNTDLLFNQSSYKIQSIDYINKTITIDKNISLPLFYENYPNTWQIHVKPSNPNESTNIIQLSEVLSSNSFKYSGVITESKFTANKSISFRNPYMYYVPTNGFNIISCANANINGFYPFFVTKHNGRYHAIIMTLTGGVWTTTHHITSTNFVTWEQCDSSNTINSIFTLGTGWWSNTQPTGLNGNLFFGNSNVSNDTHFILPVSLFVGNPYTHQRIGLAYIKKDFSSLTISTNPITFEGFDNNDSTFTLGETSMMKCNGKIYLSVERAKLPNETSVGRTVWLYEYDIINNTTKLIDSISPSRIGNEKWNDNLIQQPALFTVKGKLYLNCRGYSGTSTSIITPNSPNSGGLYYYDEVKNSLVEYFNNPMVINPKLNSGASKLFDHTGYNVYVEDGDNVYALISLTHGYNLYNILPSVLNIQSPIKVSSWIKNNK